MDLIDELLECIVLAPQPEAMPPKPKGPKLEAMPPVPEGSETQDKKFTLSTFKDHAKKKGMWAGALNPVTIPDLLGAVYVDEPPRLVLSSITRAHTPALLKIFDEIIVNATDHAKAQEHAVARQRVTLINVTFDSTNGRVTVHNDGPGIPVVVHGKATATAGYPVYVPEVAFAYFLAGTNIDKELTNVKGGINGLGAKLANVHSTEFTVETADVKNYYSQQWRNRLDTRCDPTVISLRSRHTLTPAQTQQHTTVSFIPAYAELGYKYSADDIADINAWMCLRTHQAAAYVGPKVIVTYNDVKCTTTDAASLGALLLTTLGDEADNAIVLSSTAKATVEPYKQHPWNIAIVLLPPGKKAARRAAAQNMTIVNGVLSNKGSHVLYIKRILSAAVEEKLRKATKQTEDRKMSLSETLAGIRLVMCGAIPGADWGGQRKDELQVSKEILEHYTFSAPFLKQVASAIAERILIGAGTKHSSVIHDKYTEAKWAGDAARKRNTFLLAAEGDSAITFLKAGLTQSRKAMAAGGPSLEWCGIISLQGVIINAAREVTSMETSGGDLINVRSAKLQNNKRLLMLADAFGLRYDYTYKTAKELATLNYGQLILCVDQDLDGTGKIAALVLVWIYLFWPALISAGRVGRFMTPLIRAYHKQLQPIEFYHEKDLHHWLAEDPTRSASHRIKYYKGLATNDDHEVARMFTVEAFRHSIYTYTMDDSAMRLFEVYFGADPALRKEVLVTPVLYLSCEEALTLRKQRQIPVGRVQLDVDTKSYKNEAIKRQISGGADGLNPSRRKILMGASLRFAGESSTKELKIFQLGGAVADKCFYHHGDASLNKTIIYMAQSFIGARRFPYLLGVGQFGNRHGDGAGSARYISVKLSPLIKIVFPPADRWHLQYVIEDGERAEPQYYVPVAPMNCLESCKIVSEGWNHISYGRDLPAVLRVVDAYIAGDPELLCAATQLHSDTHYPMSFSHKWPLPASTTGYHGDIRKYRGDEYSFGMYSWDAKQRTITITDLPIGVTTQKYLDTLKAPKRDGAANPRMAFIERITNQSSTDAILIQVVLQDGAFERIGVQFGNSVIDPIEDALMLRTSLRPHLNYYGIDGVVLEFGESYLSVLLYWAELRRQLYQVRITRERIILQLKIIETYEILRYIEQSADLHIADLPDEETAAELLATRKFRKLHTTLLHSPEYTTNDVLYQLVTEGQNAKYDYLLNLKEKDLVRSAANSRRARVKKLEDELIIVEAQLAESPVVGASVWRAELEMFRALY